MTFSNLVEIRKVCRSKRRAYTRRAYTMLRPALANPVTVAAKIGLSVVT